MCVIYMVQQTYLDNVNMLNFLTAEYSLFPEITGSCRIKLQLLIVLKPL